MRYNLNQYRFGVNYTPATEWYFCWNNFNPQDIANDFDAIEQLGADHIRLMLVWPWFHPNPGYVSEAHLNRLHTLMTLAEKSNLDVSVALFTGWLSGYQFAPVFTGNEPFYSAPRQLDLQKFFMTAVANTIKDCKNFLGFDLGNEINCSWQSADLTVGDSWHKQMLDLADALIPNAVHVNGVDHQPWFHPATFSPQTLARHSKIIALHCWVLFTGALDRVKDRDPFMQQPLHLIDGLGTLARTFGGDLTKPVWAQEFGMSEEWLKPERIPAFLENAMQCGIAGGVNWFTWWSSHDIVNKFEFHPVEYTLGLIDTDNKIKPQGKIFRKMADSLRGKKVQSSQNRSVAMPLPSHHTDAETWTCLEAWMNANKLGGLAGGRGGEDG
jgi:endo-1,4-beta-mannosidase